MGLIERDSPDVGNQQSDTLLDAKGLTKKFPLSKNLFRKPTGFIHAVDDVSFKLSTNESLGVVGESGCGKTTLGKILVRLTEPDEGSVLFRLPSHASDTESEVLTDISGLKGSARKGFRQRVQMIFQDPYESMNPRRTIYDIISEPLLVQGIGNMMTRIDRVTETLSSVGLTPPAAFLLRHPHELSGGQRQRVAIARAFVIRPRFVVADEPTSMLDVSSKAGIMLLMQRLAGELGISYLHVTHDLAVARYMCDRIAVMYLGKVVELAETEELLRNPLHPYTRALLSAVPNPDPTYRRTPPRIRGDLASPVNPAQHCRFYERCPIATESCRYDPHPPTEEKGPRHFVACYEV